ncbi:hypothetical protein I7I51_07010 [Histoplasma capsulatum]|uniref:Uncharacterized protein n=1 Tax=Ajellomyces capsulatus TaxID=5037 RepID=A0A8A1MQ09_AJECA|nr:hypothetical protein I7I51_07010 [Histoplasma capsulatum]
MEVYAAYPFMMDDGTFTSTEVAPSRSKFARTSFHCISAFIRPKWCSVGSTGCRIHTGRLHRTTDSQQQQQRRRRRRRRRRRKPPAPVNSIRIRMKTLDTIVCPMRNVGKGFHSQRRKD